MGLDVAKRFFMFFLTKNLSTVFLFAVGLMDRMEAGRFDDRVLISRIAARDDAALEAFYERYKGLVYSLMLRMLGDQGQAEEATLDAFTRIWQRAADYRSSRAAVKTWLVTIARNRAIDLLRMRRSRIDGDMNRRADDELESMADNGTPEADVAEQDMYRRVRAAIADLPKEQRRVLSLAYFQGMSHREISERLQQPLGTVKGRIRTAMRTLQARFQQDG
jgi:RNA polymerase sigma-70 factor (ECF subfamily)